ncbi:hypothetical protein BPAE_0216g00050 [Botrytis paeoniae]|uniref:Uncharacterized protein n=1 Tax=Botrytis paeoniae TaxID=278948 RepID=A0A4Z1FFT6_9HELO|nr:hypothetical protein BPAE_0216g00050 [Botrytis paeoniae]
MEFSIQGTFELPPLPAGVTRSSGLRLVLQQNAKNPDTFGASTTSLRYDDYVTMAKSWKMPLRAIECTNALSLLFWSSVENTGGNPHLRSGDSCKHNLPEIENQRSLSTIVLAQRDSKLQYDMGKLQYEMALASKRDFSAMKTIAILGIVFLPGTFIASILSTTFLDFQNPSGLRAAVSPSFWIYWVVTIPVTLIILVFWYLWERKRDERFVRERNEREKTEDLTSEIGSEEYDLQPLQRARPLADYE